MKRLRRSRYSHWTSLGALCVFTAAPNVIAALFWDSAFTTTPNLVSVAILVLCATAYLWSHFLEVVYFASDRLVVNTPFGSREFPLEQMALSLGHGGAKLISPAVWPPFAFSPTDFDLTADEFRQFSLLIARKTDALQRPNPPPARPPPAPGNVAGPPARPPRTVVETGDKMILATLHAKEAIAWALHLEIRERTFIDIDDAAREFGLFPLGDKWRRVDRETAARVLFAILVADMAHQSPRLSETDAQTACAEFLSKFQADSRFYTNGNWEAGWSERDSEGFSFGPRSESATAATFDGGIIVLDRSRSGVIWLEDED